MRVIYIVGASHSGSTLLDMMLNAHPKIVSVGEALKLNTIKIGTRSGQVKPARCPCGAIGVLACPFWSQVNGEVQRGHGKSLVDLNIDDYRAREERPEPNTVLFEAIAAVSNKNFIVDSSKLPRRLAYLLRQESLNVYPVYLVRSPEGQIASVVNRFGMIKSIINYEVVNAQTRAILKSVPHSVVRYEDLVLHPKQTLERILAPLGLSFDPLQLAWADQPRHSFAGNHVRLDTKSDLVLDESWKHRLSRTQRRLINLGTTLTRSKIQQPRSTA